MAIRWDANPTLYKRKKTSAVKGKKRAALAHFIKTNRIASRSKVLFSFDRSLVKGAKGKEFLTKQFTSQRKKEAGKLRDRGGAVRAAWVTRRRKYGSTGRGKKGLRLVKRRR